LRRAAELRRIPAITPKTRCFIGVDIGGTFTDVVVAESVSHRLFTAKTLTTPDNPGRAVISAIQAYIMKVMR
jgi:N-methylhydantoinase A/oxoprolinase/acetone carboxylase beta subunit